VPMNRWASTKVKNSPASVVRYNNGPVHAVCLCGWRGPDRHPPQLGGPANRAWLEARDDARVHRETH
jgi:hypothetical protein